MQATGIKDIEYDALIHAYVYSHDTSVLCDVCDMLGHPVACIFGQTAEVLLFTVHVTSNKLCNSRKVYPLANSTFKH